MPPVPIMADHSVDIRLSDLGLFTTRKRHEQFSQRERAMQMRDQFAHCMRSALCNHDCVMPSLCANSTSLHERLECAHLYIGHGQPRSSYSGMLVIDLDNFTGNGIPLTKQSREKILKRIRAIGTLVYRAETGCDGARLGTYAGDVYLEHLEKVSTFTGGPRKRAKRVAPRQAKRTKSTFLWGLFG